MKVAVIMGGHESEHEVSLRSGQTALKALSRLNPMPVIIDQDLQTWHIQQPLRSTEALDYLKQNIDVAVLMLHGPFGEDGTIQGALEAAGIAYTGSDVFASATAMSKSLSGLLFQDSGITTPEFVSFTKTSLDQPHEQQNLESLGYPLVIKPENGGSSVGIHFVSSWEELVAAAECSQFTDFIAQKQVHGRELTCGVLDVTGEPEALPVVEIKPNNPYFDYESKYTPGASQEITPAELTETETKNVQQVSVKAHLLLGASGITRSDFILCDDKLYMLELNTAPGMTPTSLIPQELEAAGKDLSQVLTALCDQGASRE